jgi:hypothetical protein
VGVLEPRMESEYLSHRKIWVMSEWDLVLSCSEGPCSCSEGPCGTASVATILMARQRDWRSIAVGAILGRVLQTVGMLNHDILHAIDIA